MTPQLTIVAPQVSPRLAYTAGVVFGRVLGWQVRVVPLAGYAPAEGPALWYVPADLLPPGGLPQGQLHLQPAALLSGSGTAVVQPALPPWPDQSQPPPVPLLPDEHGQPVADPLAAAFYLLAEYDMWTRPQHDSYGRYLDTARYVVHTGLHAWPAIHHWAAGLARQLGLFPEKREYDYLLTIDADYPYRVRYKPLWKVAGSGARELLRRQWPEARARLRMLAGGADPYDTWDYALAAAGKPGHTRIFWLGGGTHANDNGFSYSNRGLRALIRQMAASGAGMGLHPSFETMNRPELMAAQKTALEQILDAPVTHARQHYLRYRLPGIHRTFREQQLIGSERKSEHKPGTYRLYLQLGIQHDYTTALPNAPGWKHGMAVAFPWYDLPNETETPLLLHPSNLMDRSLQRYGGLSPAQSLPVLQQVLARSRQAGGTFIPILHNNTLAGLDEWRGWTDFFQILLQKMQEKE